MSRMSRIIRQRRAWLSSCLLLLVSLGAVSLTAADPIMIFGRGPIVHDPERWDHARKTQEESIIDTFTEKMTGKRILFISRSANIVTGEDPLVLLQRLVRGPNDLTITATPKVEQGTLAGGILANYETMRLEKVAIVIRPNGTQATVFISTNDNPLEDPVLVEIKRLVEGG